LSVQVTVKQLLEAGVHFGHQTRRWNPKMARFIYGERNGIYIIDLEKTLVHLNTACEFLSKLASQGQQILLVGTKKQAQESLLQMAQATEMPYVQKRWLGGMLTNFETIRKSIRRLEQIELMEQEGTYRFMTKKEVGELRKEREKLNQVLAGIRKMPKLPGAVFVIDPVKEDIAVHEARKLGLPVVALIDTNCDPDLIDYPVPGNDDAIRSVKLICEVVQKSIAEGKAIYQHQVVAEEVEEAALAEEEESEVLEPPILPAGPNVSALETPIDLPVIEPKPAAEEIVEVIEEQVVSKLEDKEKPRAKKAKAKKEL